MIELSLQIAPSVTAGRWKLVSHFESVDFIQRHNLVASILLFTWRLYSEPQ
jgi:hypothetical protein